MHIISKIRNEKSSAGIPLSKSVEKIVIYTEKSIIQTLKEVEEEIKQILHIGEIAYNEREILKVELN